MIEFELWDLASAQAYHQAYVAAVPERVSWLREEVRRTGGPEGAVDGTLESTRAALGLAPETPR